MSANSKIEWTDRTWNPVSGCSFASEGCRNCYAVRMTHRLEAMGQVEKYGGLTVLSARKERHFNGTVKTHETTLAEPFGWKKPQRVFVNSMSDLFHPGVPFEFIDQVFAVMALCRQHTFQVLTKRPDRMAEYFNTKPYGEDGWSIGRGEHGIKTVLFDWQQGGCEWLNNLPIWHEYRGLIPLADLGGEAPFPLPNVWLGTSVEHQAAADKRIPHLLKCPAAVRFLSCEPLLGPVDLEAHIDAGDDRHCSWCGGFSEIDGKHDCYDPTLGIHWVVAGGESGPKARPMHPDWVRGLRDQCAAAAVPFHFKQWGAWRDVRTSDPIRGGQRQILRGGRVDCVMIRVGKKAAGRTLDGITHDAFPEATHA